MFLPMFKFSAENAILVIMAVDVIGIAFGWKFFDHAAHLGGALFGVYVFIPSKESTILQILIFNFFFFQILVHVR